MEECLYIYLHPSCRRHDMLCRRYGISCHCHVPVVASTCYGLLVTYRPRQNAGWVGFSFSEPAHGLPRLGFGGPCWSENRLIDCLLLLSLQGRDASYIYISLFPIPANVTSRDIQPMGLLTKTQTRPWVGFLAGTHGLGRALASSTSYIWSLTISCQIGHVTVSISLIHYILSVIAYLTMDKSNGKFFFSSQTPLRSSQKASDFWLVISQILTCSSGQWGIRD